MSNISTAQASKSFLSQCDDLLTCVLRTRAILSCVDAVSLTPRLNSLDNLDASR